MRVRTRSADACSSNKSKNTPRQRHSKQIRLKSNGWSSSINSRLSSNNRNTRKSRNSWNKNSRKSGKSQSNHNLLSVRRSLDEHGSVDSDHRDNGRD